MHLLRIKCWSYHLFNVINSCVGFIHSWIMSDHLRCQILFFNCLREIKRWEQENIYIYIMWRQWHMYNQKLFWTCFHCPKYFVEIFSPWWELRQLYSRVIHIDEILRMSRSAKIDGYFQHFWHMSKIWVYYQHFWHIPVDSVLLVRFLTYFSKIFERCK